MGVGAGTAVFVCGWCFCPRARVRSLSFVVDGEIQPVTAQLMPRGDVFKALHPRIDPYGTRGLQERSRLGRGSRAAQLPERLLGPGEDRAATRAGRAATWFYELSSRTATRSRPSSAGSPSKAPDTPLRAEPPEPGGGPFVAVCMATFNPPPHLLRRQLDSIRAQTHRNWVCVISDDCSSPESIAAIEEAVAGDPRFIVSRSPERLRFYRNFERALALAPANADYVAMSDQDDFWHPDKLETLLDAIGGSQLVFSDARIIDREGEVISDTYWSIRRPNHQNLLSLLMANSVTGAASLFRRDVLDYALPFPPRQFSHFHDHWIGLVARVLGEVAFVERPLYDYVQHGNAVLGHAGANWMPPLRDRLGWLKKDPKERVRSWRLHYFVDCCRLIQFRRSWRCAAARRCPLAGAALCGAFPTPSALRSHGPISAAGRCASCSASRRRSAPRSRCSSPLPGDDWCWRRHAVSSALAATSASTLARR